MCFNLNILYFNQILPDGKFFNIRLAFYESPYDDMKQRFCYIPYSIQKDINIETLVPSKKSFTISFYPHLNQN